MFTQLSVSEEITFKYSKSAGRGGQHVNTSRNVLVVQYQNIKN